MKTPSTESVATEVVSKQDFQDLWQEAKIICSDDEIYAYFCRYRQTLLRALIQEDSQN